LSIFFGGEIILAYNVCGSSATLSFLDMANYLLFTGSVDFLKEFFGDACKEEEGFALVFTKSMLFYPDDILGVYIRFAFYLENYS